VLVGPLAIVAALFPATFARLAVGMTRWRAFLVVASLTSTLALVYYWVREYLPDSRWLGPQAFAGYLIAAAAVGLVWAGRRYRVLAAADPAVTAPPTRNELLALAGLTVFAGLALAAVVWFTGQAGLIELPWREFTAITAGLAAATAYAVYRSATTGRDRPPPHLSLSGESVGLAAMLVFGAAALVGTWPRGNAAFATAGEVGEAAGGAGGPKLAEVKLLFESADAHQVLSGVTVAADRLLFGTMKQSGFRSGGVVFCIDRATGQPVWTFDDGGGLKPVFATPAADGDRVFVGEGLHTDADRRLFSLDAATGRPLWLVPTASHTEGSPRVAGDRVVFPAGDDGLYCVSAADGKELWHVRGAEQNLHVDSPPAVAGRRVFFGSGYHTLALLCVDVNDGRELWRTPVDLRSFGPPLARGSHVYFGLGTGNLVEDLSAEPEVGVPPETRPAGAVVCLDAKTGAVVWRFDLPKSVHTPLAADGRSVYACGKDGWVYALGRADGRLRWKRRVGDAFAAGPAVAGYARGAAAAAVYAVSRDGRAVALDPADGSPFWTRDLGEVAKRTVEVFSTPVVAAADPDGARRHVYVGAMLTNRNNQAKAAAVFRIEDVVEE
jgi:outer membrane protein assembly factor BamB